MLFSEFVEAEKKKLSGQHGWDCHYCPDCGRPGNTACTCAATPKRVPGTFTSNYCVACGDKNNRSGPHCTGCSLNSLF